MAATKAKISYGCERVLLPLKKGRFCADADSLPDEGGAYVLLIELAGPLEVELRRVRSVLPAGQYLYCGSAYGPGGIRAWAGRHMRRDKAMRWHVDRLTAAGRVSGAWVFPGGNECELVRALAELPAPVPGFGSSDCLQCISHLLAWPADKWGSPLQPAAARPKFRRKGNTGAKS